MIKKKYRCIKCGHEFVKDVFEEGELEEVRKKQSNIRPVPVRCEQCGGSVEPV